MSLQQRFQACCRMALEFRRARVLLAVGALCLLLLLVGVAWYGSQDGAPPSVQEEQTALEWTDGGVNSMWETAAWPTLALVIVLGLLYASLWAVRALSPQGRTRGNAQSRISLENSIRLNNNQGLHLVRFGSRLLLVGSSQAGLGLLAEMPCAEADGPTAGFEHLLEQQMTEEKRP